MNMYDNMYCVFNLSHLRTIDINEVRLVLVITLLCFFCRGEKYA